MSSYLSSLFLEPVFRRRDRTGSSSSSATHQESGHTSTDNISPPLSGAGSGDDSDGLLNPVAEEQLGRNQRSARTTESAAGQQLLPSLLQNLDTQSSPGNSTLYDRGIQLEGSRALTFGHSSIHENERTEMSNSTSDVGEASVAPAEGEASGSTVQLTEPRGASTRGPYARQNTAEQPTDVTMEEVGGGEKSPTRLPADDGKTLLRRRIHAIRDTEVSNSEKARLVHELMTEEYHSSQPGSETHLPLEARSPASLQSLERPWTPASPQSRYSSDHPSLTPASTASIALSDDPYYLRPDDSKPSFVPAGENSGEDYEPRLGCQHYKRNVKLQCFTCKRWYPCRFCHDAVENHSLDRKSTEHMLCMLCGSPQPAAEWCRKCGKLASWYYCSICKLWDDDNEKSIYHCNDCGICRIGQGLGKDFFHCKVRIFIYQNPMAQNELPLIPYRLAVYACLCQSRQHINASSVRPNATAQSVASICSPHQRPLFSCDAGIVFTTNASRNILRLHIVALYVARLFQTWRRILGAWTGLFKANRCHQSLLTRKL